jgi:hypothetical protein
MKKYLLGFIAITTLSFSTTQCHKNNSHTTIIDANPVITLIAVITGGCMTYYMTQQPHITITGNIDGSPMVGGSNLPAVMLGFIAGGLMIHMTQNTNDDIKKDIKKEMQDIKNELHILKTASNNERTKEKIPLNK